MPAGNDHQAGRMKIGPDRKLYYTIGDQGNNQLGNYCIPIESQRLPTQAEIQAKNYVAYVGKSLRLNLDGSIPNDNPEIAGVRSHVFTYGHRNPQGIDFGPGWHVVRVGARSEDRRRDQHSEGGCELRVAACGGNEGRQGVRLRPVGGVDDAVRADQIQRPGDSRDGAARAGVRVHQTVHTSRSRRCSRCRPGTTSAIRCAAASTISAGRRWASRASNTTGLPAIAASPVGRKCCW